MSALAYLMPPDRVDPDAVASGSFAYSSMGRKGSAQLWWYCGEISQGEPNIDGVLIRPVFSSLAWKAHASSRRAKALRDLIYELAPYLIDTRPDDEDRYEILSQRMGIMSDGIIEMVRIIADAVGEELAEKLPESGSLLNERVQEEIAELAVQIMTLRPHPRASSSSSQFGQGIRQILAFTGWESIYQIKSGDEGFFDPHDVINRVCAGLFRSRGEDFWAETEAGVSRYEKVTERLFGLVEDTLAKTLLVR